MANRKLQGEIDRVLKKINEGSAEFESILAKVYAASSQNLKEKHEGDLKKEIKKLQRYRDQIKTWLTYPDKDVKDKKALMDARRAVERHMERFRDCEKETKTKAYSKEGLQKLSAELDVKGPLRTWLQDSIERLEEQLKEYESLLSDYNLSDDPDLLEKTITLEHTIERHNVHIENLKTISSAWENDTVTKQQIKAIKRPVDEYIENNQDEDYYEDEDIYDAAGINTTGGVEIIDELNGVSEGVLPTVKNESNKLDNDPEQKNTLTVDNTKSDNPNTSVSPSISKKPQFEKPPKIGIKQDSTRQPSPNRTPSIEATTHKFQQMQMVSGISKSSTSLTTSDDDVKNNDTFSSSEVVSRMKPGTLEEMSSNTRDRLGSNTGNTNTPQHHMNTTPPQQPSDARTVTRQQKLHLLQQSSRFMPKDVQAPYKPSNPVATPPYYPTTPLVVFDSPALYKDFKVDTLFFIFYYIQRQPQQYLAARELNSRSWRFHTKYLTWFQRHKEPIESTNEYEKGTYIYFDYESGWCQRKKTEFVFEYVYLEDQFYESVDH